MNWKMMKMTVVTPPPSSPSFASLSLSPLLFCFLPLLLSPHCHPPFLLLPPSRFIPLLLLLSLSFLTPLALLPILLHHFYFRRRTLRDSSTILRMRRWRNRFMRDCVVFCGVRPHSRYPHGEEPPLASRSAMHAIAPTRSMRDYPSSSHRVMETFFTDEIVVITTTTNVRPPSPPSHPF